MKRFVIIVLSFWLFWLLIIGTIHLSWIVAAPSLQRRNILNDDFKNLFLGPSNAECAVNDSILPGYKNLCLSALSMGGCYNRLKWIEEYNSKNIDTLFLCSSLVAISFYNDNYLSDMIEAGEEKSNILNYSTFFKYYKKIPKYWYEFFTSFPISNFQFPLKGGYLWLERDKLDHPDLYNAINGIIRLAGGKENLTSDFYRKCCKYQLENLKKIKEYCCSHGITLVIFSTPLYKIPDMLNDQGFRQLIKEDLGDSVLVADYSRFAFPDSTYYGDLEHLNHKGAKYFSESIAKNGIKCEYAVDYCRKGAINDN